MRATATRCWRCAVPNITGPSIGCLRAINNDCGQRKNHRMLPVMSIPVVAIIESDGTLRYDCGQDIAVRVLLHRRNGTKKCPVELLYQNTSVLMTESNL